MKYLLSTMFFLTLNLVFSQNPNIYEIDKKIKLNYISIEIKCMHYRPDGGKILEKVAINRYSDTLSHLFKVYDRNDTIGDHKLSLKELFLKGAIKVPTSKFDEIAPLLKNLDIDKINKSYNEPGHITDGCFYLLTFAGNNYTIQARAHSPEVASKERGLTDYYKLCRKIWDLAEDY